MESAWEKVQPKHIFRVAKQLPLDERRKETLIHLYQPIVGTVGIGLYFTLLADIHHHYGISESLLHADLLVDCDISIQQFYETRSKLEGIGLLSSFVKQDEKLGKVFLYQLHDPLVPESFLKDDLLVFLLKERVSDNKFNQLLKFFLPKVVDSTGYVETTKSFKEIYAFHQEKFSAEYDQITNFCQSFDISDEKPTSLSQNELDWNLVADLLKRQGIITTISDDEKKEVTLYHSMYGMNEIELAELLSRTANIVDAKIDMKAFKNAQRQLSQKNKQSKETAIEASDNLSDDEKNTYRYNSLKLDGFSDFDIQIIKEAEQYPPMTYFQAIKDQKGGYITEPENWVIRDLVNKSGLPNSVINFLIHYVLVVRNAPVLNASYVNTIANEWAQKNIHSPEAALKHIREVNEPTEKKATTRKRNYSRRVRTEKVPEWMNKQSIPEAKLSPERQAELDEKLKDFLKEGD